MKQKQILSLLLALVMVLSLFACAKNNNSAAAPAETVATEAPAAATEAPAEPSEAPVEQPAELPAEPAAEGVRVVGEGATKVTIVVTIGEEVRTIELHTDEADLAAAMKKEGLASGSESEYGFMADTIDGYFADPAKGEWWVFTKNGEMWMNSADKTDLADGDSYEWSVLIY